MNGTSQSPPAVVLAVVPLAALSVMYSFSGGVQILQAMQYLIHGACIFKMFTTVKTLKDVFFRDTVMMIRMVVVVVVMKSRISLIPYRTLVFRTHQK